jgi:hypothetical protein
MQPHRTLDAYCLLPRLGWGGAALRQWAVHMWDVADTSENKDTSCFLPGPMASSVTIWKNRASDRE